MGGAGTIKSGAVLKVQCTGSRGSLAQGCVLIGNGTEAVYTQAQGWSWVVRLDTFTPWDTKLNSVDDDALVKSVDQLIFVPVNARGNEFNGVDDDLGMSIYARRTVVFEVPCWEHGPIS